jgi:NAD(P)-dependent dehydrogenase (short-subunit alcohol dehydrogenase family)
MLELNLIPTFLLAKYAAREMARNHWGRIVNVASRAAVSGQRNASAYAVAKGGVVTLTEAQAEETRDQGITVNAVLPSIIDSPANRKAMPSAAFDRWPKPEEIARIIAFLASDDAALISGASIPVYGLA